MANLRPEKSTLTMMVLALVFREAGVVGLLRCWMRCWVLRCKSAKIRMRVRPAIKQSTRLFNDTLAQQRGEAENIRVDGDFAIFDSAKVRPPGISVKPSRCIPQCLRPAWNSHQRIRGPRANTRVRFCLLGGHKQSLSHSNLRRSCTRHFWTAHFYAVWWFGKGVEGRGEEFGGIVG